MMKYLTTCDVAKILGVNVRTVSKWARKGHIPHMKTLGGHRRFALEDVEKVREQMVNAEVAS